MSRFAPILRTRPRVRVALAALACAVGCGALAAPLAHAKTYKVHVCKAPDGSGISLPASQWTATNAQPFSAAAEGCSVGNPLALYMGSPGAPDYGAGLAARWVFRAPVYLAGVRVWRSVLTTTNPRDFSATPEFQALARSAGGAEVLDACSVHGACQRGDSRLAVEPVNEVYWSFRDPTTSVLELFVHCGGSPGGTCGNGGAERIIAGFHRFEFDAVDNDAPKLVDGSALGTLLESGQQKGVRSLRFSAVDYHSGLYEAVVRIDGTVVARMTPDFNGGRCIDAGHRPGPDFYEFKPCPNVEKSLEFSVDSNTFADGAHKLEVDAIDAAGNATRVVEREVTFENIPPPANLTRPTLRIPVSPSRPGDAIEAVPGSWRGSDIKFSYQWQRSVDGAAWGDIPKATNGIYVVQRDDIGKRVRVIVTATNIQGATSVISDPTGAVESGASVIPSGDVPMAPEDLPTNGGGGGNPSTAQLVVDREQRTVEVSHGAKIVITGRLVDADGQPLANAQVDVFEQLVLTAAPWVKIGTVTTDSQGGYALRPRTTASRRLRFAFAEQRDSANYRSMREVLVSVRAGMTISAKSHVLNPRQLIRLRGRVSVDALPKKGTWVEIQVLDGQVWRTVATRKTSSKGLWTFKHRLRQSSGVTFRFRSRLRVVGDVASAEAKSRQIKVRIR